MKDKHQIVSPGRTQGQVRSQSGKELVPPVGWAFLPAGDAAVTRRVKAVGPVWVVQVTRGRRKISKGIWADDRIIQAAQEYVQGNRSTPAYARQREQAAARRQAKQDNYVADFSAQIVLFLNFHTKYEALASRLGKIISAHAAPIGSGTVARTQRIPIEKRAEAAIIAWMRHWTTAYDTMTIPRIKGQRRQVRRNLAKNSVALLKPYRQGLDVDKTCPLKKAVEIISNDPKSNLG